MSSQNTLVVEQLKKRFGGVVALDGVNLRILDKSVTMIIGPNGSGKTTLINVISGLYKPDRGRILFNGLNITGWPPYKVYSAGVVRTFQVPAVFAKLTVLENLLIAARSHPGEKLTVAPFKLKWSKYEEELVEKAFHIMQLLNIDHLWNQPASSLSGGQMKLLEIGRALMSSPKVVLMDEPIAGINPALAHMIFNHILELRKQLGLTFLIVEHRLDIALKYVDYVYAMASGKVICKGEPKDVVNDPTVIRSYLGE
ncbi:MAG TPA: ABC transporter ATP-binding protein [Candidatus Methanomethylia archaeon]|nr:ABC transporter ATP-binding protein [Candidatus Methanomethylicia archaeon]